MTTTIVAEFMFKSTDWLMVSQTSFGFTESSRTVLRWKGNEINNSQYPYIDLFFKTRCDLYNTIKRLYFNELCDLS